MAKSVIENSLSRAHSQELTLEEKAALFDKIASLIGNYKPAKKTIEKKHPDKTIFDLLKNQEYIDKYTEKTVKAFCTYWGEKDSRGTELRKKQKVFNTQQRMDTRKHNELTNFGRNPIADYNKLEEFDKGMRSGKQDDIIKQLGEGYAKKKEEWKNSSLYL